MLFFREWSKWGSGWDSFQVIEQCRHIMTRQYYSVVHKCVSLTWDVTSWTLQQALMMAWHISACLPNLCTPDLIFCKLNQAELSHRVPLLRNSTESLLALEWVNSTSFSKASIYVYKILNEFLFLKNIGKLCIVFLRWFYVEFVKQALI